MLLNRLGQAGRAEDVRTDGAVAPSPRAEPLLQHLILARHLPTLVTSDRVSEHPTHGGLAQQPAGVWRDRGGSRRQRCRVRASQKPAARCENQAPRGDRSQGKHLCHLPIIGRLAPALLPARAEALIGARARSFEERRCAVMARVPDAPGSARGKAGCSADRP